MFNNMYNNMHNNMYNYVLMCAYVCQCVVCVCACPHVFFCMKDFNTLPLLRRTPSSQLWSSSCGHWVGFHSHGMSWSTPTAWWFTMENHGKSHEILWKSYGNPMEIGWFRATPMETPMILVASFDSFDYSNTKWHSHGHAACWCVFKWLFNGKICIMAKSCYI